MNHKCKGPAAGLRLPLEDNFFQVHQDLEWAPGGCGKLYFLTEERGVWEPLCAEPACKETHCLNRAWLG